MTVDKFYIYYYYKIVLSPMLHGGIQMTQVTHEDRDDSFTPIMQYPEGAKLGIQKSMREKHPRVFINEFVRRHDFRTLIDSLFVAHFTLVTQSGKKIDGLGVGESIKSIVDASMRFYSNQGVFLSVSDYVTDFLDIVISTDLAVALKH